MKPKNKKLEAYHRGHRAEWIAATLLWLKGYRILARRFKTPVGEIDIVVRRGRVLAFVEVKQRRTRAEAMESIHAKNQERVMRAAEYYMRACPEYAGLSPRFDAIILVPPFTIVHLDNAWQSAA